MPPVLQGEDAKPHRKSLTPQGDGIRAESQPWNQGRSTRRC